MERLLRESLISLCKHASDSVSWILLTKLSNLATTTKHLPFPVFWVRILLQPGFLLSCNKLAGKFRRSQFCQVFNNSLSCPLVKISENNSPSNLICQSVSCLTKVYLSSNFWTDLWKIGPSVDDQAVSLWDDGTTIIIDFLVRVTMIRRLAYQTMVPL